MTFNTVKPALKSYRLFMLLTQNDMARKLNISRQSYSNKERGITPFSDKEKLEIRDLIRLVDNSATIDNIFFDSK